MKRRHVRMAIVFTFIFILITITTFLLAAFINSVLYHYNIVIDKDPRHVLLIFIVVSIVISSVLSLLFGKKMFKTIHVLNEATKEIANGNYNIQIHQDSRAIELHSLINNFNKMARDLANNEIMRNDFIENVSHEFKTPLASIQGYANLLSNPDLKENERIDCILKIQDSSERLSNLTQHILLLSKLENQELGITKESFSLTSQIQDVILDFEWQWASKDIQLDLDLQEVEVLANRDLLYQVWQNLFLNAIHFSQPTQSIQFIMRESQDYVTITIQDYGCGMSEETISHIFDKFYQADSSRTHKGNGLGLALVQRIIDLHQGSIQVISKIDRGSTFIITLPIMYNHHFSN